MDPLCSIFHKVFQETCRHAGTCPFPRGIIGKVRTDRPFDHLMVDRSHRQLPVIFSGLLRCFFPAAKRFPVIAKQRNHLISQGTLCRIRQSGKVDHGARPHTLRKRDTVTQYQPSFRIGVVDFHGLSCQRCDHISHLYRIRADHIFCEHQHCHHIFFDFLYSKILQYLHHFRCPAHIVLHAVHAIDRLQMIPPGIKHQPFSDQCGPVSPRCALIAKHYHGSLSPASLIDC